MLRKFYYFFSPDLTIHHNLKELKKNHQFISYGTEIVMKQVSECTGFEATMIANLSLNDLKIKDITPGSFYTCQYENDYFVSMENQDLNIEFLHPKGPVLQWF